MNIMLGSDIDLLRIPLTIISKSVEEITLEFSTKGITINCIDKEHVQFSNVFLSEESFEIYDVPEEIKCSVDCQILLKAVNKAHGDEYIKIIVNEDINTLTIHVVNDTTGIKKQYNIRTIDANYSVPHAPVMDLPVQFEIDAKELQQAIKDITLDKIDRISLKTENNNLQVNTMSEFELNNITIPLDVTVEDVNASYDFTRVNTILGATKYSPSCTVEIGTDLPLCITYNDEISSSKFVQILAPRMETEGYD